MTLDLSKSSDSLESGNYQSEQQKIVSFSAEKTERGAENYRFFSFFINDTEYLLPIAKVEEVTNLPSISFLPNANRFLDGAFHLRGNILPAINMRKISGYPRGEHSTESRLIMVREAGLNFGLIVDRINQVITLSADQIEYQTQSSSPNSEHFCSQNFKNGNRFIGIIELSKLLTLITCETNLDLS